MNFIFHVNPDFDFPIGPTAQQSLISLRQKESFRAQEMRHLYQKVESLCFRSFKSPVLSCLTLRQLNLERVNPGELGITNAESQHET